MKIELNNHRVSRRLLVVLTLLVALTLTSGAIGAEMGTCNGATVTVPFTDVGGSIFFCQIAEAYFSGLTNGTTATTYSPHDPVPRDQMAAFITRTMDQSIKRSSHRGALNQWWVPDSLNPNALTPVGDGPLAVQSDGTDIWVASDPGNTVTRIRASDGKILETWTGMVSPRAILVTSGRIYVAGGANNGKLYAIDPDQPAGNAVLVTQIGDFPAGMAFDGSHIITANGSSVTNYHVPSGIKITYTNGLSSPSGALYDGANFWITDEGDQTLKKIHVSGQILQTVNVGAGAGFPTFDGTNIWVPNTGGDSITVVRAATGAVLATLTGNGLDGPAAAAFDGERIAVTNYNGNSVSIFRATDFAPLGTFSTGAATHPFAACSDGISFWITLASTDRLGRL